MDGNAEFLWIMKELGLVHLHDDIMVRTKTQIEDGRLISVDLSDLGLHQLPKGLFSTCYSLEDLYLNENRISSLSLASLNGLSGLKTLDLSGNQLTALPKGIHNKLPKLEVLRLDGNKFREFRLEDFRELKSLSVANNEITEVVWKCISGLSNLQSLDIHGNPLSKIDALPPSLINLDASFCHLSDIDPRILKPLAYLEVLNLANNKLVELHSEHFEHLLSLKHLFLQGNGLVSLDLPFLPNLSHLIVSSNRLKTLPKISNLPSLRFLIASENCLHQLPFNDICNSKIEELWVSGNPELADFNTNILGRASLIQMCQKQKFKIGLLTLMEEVITIFEADISPNQLLKREDTLVLNNDIKSLDLSGTGIDKLPRLSNHIASKLKTIEKLNLSNNKINKIPPNFFSIFNNLVMLNLEYNPLIALPSTFCNDLPSIKILKLKGTYLPSCWRRNFVDDFDIVEFKEWFDLNRECILLLTNLFERQLASISDCIRSEYTIVNHGKVYSLDLSNQQLESLPDLSMLPITELGRLIARRNLLTDVDLKIKTTAPLIIDLSSNKLHSIKIEANLISELIVANNDLNRLSIKGEVQKADLSFCSIDDQWIDHQPISSDLEELNLSNNRLQKLDLTHMLRKFSALNTLNVSSNPLETIIIDHDALEKMPLKSLNLGQTPIAEDKPLIIEGSNKIKEFFLTFLHD